MLRRVLVLKHPRGYFENSDLSRIIDFTNIISVSVAKQFINYEGYPALLVFTIIEKQIDVLSDETLKIELKTLDHFLNSVTKTLESLGVKPRLLTTKEIISLPNLYKKFDTWIEYISVFDTNPEAPNNQFQSYQFRGNYKKNTKYSSNYNKNNFKPDNTFYIGSNRIPRLSIPSEVSPALDFKYFLGYSAENRKIGINEVSLLLSGSNQEHRKLIVKTLIHQLLLQDKQNTKIVVLDFGLHLGKITANHSRFYSGKDLNFDPFTLYEEEFKLYFIEVFITILSEILGLRSQYIPLLEDLISSYLESENSNHYSLLGFEQYVKEIINGTAPTTGVSPVSDKEELKKFDLQTLLNLGQSPDQSPNFRDYDIISTKLNYLISTLPFNTSINDVLSKPGISFIDVSQNIAQLNQVLFMLINLYLNSVSQRIGFVAPIFIMLNLNSIFKDSYGYGYQKNERFPKKSLIQPILQASIPKIWDINSLDYALPYRENFHNFITTNQAMFPSNYKLNDEILVEWLGFLRNMPQFVALQRNDLPNNFLIFKPYLKEYKEEFLYPSTKKQFILLLSVLELEKILPLTKSELWCYLNHYDYNVYLEILQSIQQDNWIKHNKKKLFSNTQIELTDKSKNLLKQLSKQFLYLPKLHKYDVEHIKTTILDLKDEQENKIETSVREDIELIYARTIGEHFRRQSQFPNEFLFYYLEYINTNIETSRILQYLDLHLETILESIAIDFSTTHEDQGQRNTKIQPKIKQTIVSNQDPSMVPEKNDIIHDEKLKTDVISSNYTSNVQNLITEINTISTSKYGSDLVLPKVSISIINHFVDEVTKDRLEELYGELMNEAEDSGLTLLSSK